MLDENSWVGTVDRRAAGSARTSAKAFSVATGLMLLASSAQTADGFVYSGFGGTLDALSTPTADVLAIGDGASDATELAALLRAPGLAPEGRPEAPYRVSIEAGQTLSATTVKVFPTVDPSTAGTRAHPESARTYAIPTVDEQGRVDCSGSVSCDTDPLTEVTTVTYPDGIVAMVQKVKDLTVVAYKTLERSPVLQELKPPLPAQSVTTPIPEPTAEAPPSPPVSAPSPPTAVTPVDPGPPAPDAATVDEGVRRGPKVKATPPPPDFNRADLGEDLPRPNVPKPKIPGLGNLKEALGSAVDAIKDAVGSSVSPVSPGVSEQPNRGTKR